MTQAIATRDQYLTDFEALDRELAGQPSWLRQLRTSAFERFAELGFPTARHGNEKWKYTDVSPIARAPFAYPSEASAAVSPSDIRRVAPWDESWTNLVFVDGCYSPALSSRHPEQDGARVLSLSESLADSDRLLERHLAQHAAFQDDAFVALNTAFLQDGAVVHVPEGVSAGAPIHLLFATTTPGIVSYPRTLIVAERRSRLTVIETYVSLSRAPLFADSVTEIVLEEGSKLDHYHLPLDSVLAFHVGVSRVHQDEGSRFSQVFFARGSALTRNDLRVTLDGPQSTCTLNGLYVTSDNQHIDNFINIDHAKPHATSRLNYRGILDGKSRAVFGGMVLVRPGAMKTDAHQEDKNLLLSDEAEVDSKPSLEIYADDVKCGHGATAGTVAEDALFYMRSRGLDVETASAFLIKGFASAVTDSVRVPAVRRFIDRHVAEILRGVRFGLTS